MTFDFSAQFAALLQETAFTMDAFGTAFSPDVRPADPRFGHFQANGVLPLAKALGTNPRGLAQSLVDALDPKNPLLNGVEISIAGPGFINARLSGSWFVEWLRDPCTGPLLDQALALLGDYPSRVVVDFSSPNTAKQMHVGHIRSTVIGDSISRLLSASGHQVIRDNHIGDWGTQFGILLVAVRETNTDLDQLGEDPLAVLEDLYRTGTRLCEEDPEKKNNARQLLLSLQNGEPEATRAWKRINQISMQSFESIYRHFDVTFDLTHGESFYQDKVDHVCEELSSLGIAEVSDGALVVFHRDHPRFATQPFIIRKSDGASNYATTDLATLLFRSETLGADRIIYVTDARQQDHFEQLFLTAEKWFLASGRKLPKLDHVYFGKMLGEDGKAIKTRSGDSIKLLELVEEGIRRAMEIVASKNPQLSAEEQSKIASTIGVDAIRYADLMQNRTIDYVFSWEKLISFDGNTAPYLLYAVARIHGIFRKLNLDPESFDASGASALETSEELALAALLVEFPVAFQQALADLRPHFLCTWLFRCTVAFGSFYNANHVMVEDSDIRTRRLLLCSRTLKFLETGLKILGLRPLQRM
ncbi:MAG: arginine--tRNA ligase [Puniceicoccaceae bacterium]